MSPVAPVMVRPGTTDVTVFGEVYLRRVFDVECPVPPVLIVDAGAYTGISTRWLCDRYPEAKVLGFEPHPEHAKLAGVNAPLALIRTRALAAESGKEIVLRDSDRGEWAASTLEGHDGARIATVPTMNLDEALPEGWTPDLVKMDVEGMEREILEADPEWLRTVALLFIETHDRFLPGCTKALQEALDRTGRRYTWATREGSDSHHVITFEGERDG
ncbi:MAG: FkbM family methyltransferase [Longimicrobiales bacterium]